MRNYTAENYKTLVEKTKNHTLQEYMQAEQVFVRGIPNLADKTIVDLGAGHGRALSFLAPHSKEVVALEINPSMFDELKERASQYANVVPIRGDMLELSQVLPPEMKEPIFLILQNSLGVIEGGESNDVLNSVVNEAKKRHGQILLSVFKQSGLKENGLPMYRSLEPMVGKVDAEKSDLERGVFVSTTGYVSKWWTEEEINKFRRLGKVIREENTKTWSLMLLEP